MKGECSAEEFRSMEDDCQEIIPNADGSVTFVFDEPLGGTSSTTIKAEFVAAFRSGGVVVPFRRRSTR